MAFTLLATLVAATATQAADQLIDWLESERTSYLGLTTTERDALTPVEGDLIYNTTTNQFEYYTGSAWAYWLTATIADYTEDTSPDTAADFLLFYDTTEGVWNKVKPDDLGIGGGGSSAPFVDSTAIIKGSADATKLLAIEVDGQTTATTRTWTSPDQDLDLTPITGDYLGTTIASYTEDASPDTAADWVLFHDTSAGTWDKIQVEDLPGGDLVTDTTPQLGGNLDLNSFTITDTNGTDAITVSTATFSVNGISIKTAATGNAPTISATGSDTNIDLILAPAGTGTVTYGGFELLTVGDIGSLVLDDSIASYTEDAAPDNTADYVIFHDASANTWDKIKFEDLPGGGSSSPFADSTAILKGSADATKLLAIEVDGITTATTRTWTAPDQDLDLTPASGDYLSRTIGDYTTDAAPTTAADYVLFHDASAGTWDKVLIDDLPTGTSEVIDDTTPQLGGDLDTNSFHLSFDTAHGINDENGNEQLRFTTTASAVNHLTFANAEAAAHPSITATGDDTDININLIPKGSGVVTIDGSEVALKSGGSYTGTHNYGAASELEIPNAAAPTLTNNGAIALDTTITDHTGLPMVRIGGANYYIPAIPVADLTTTDNDGIFYDATGNKFTMEAQAGGGGGDNGWVYIEQVTASTSASITFDNIDGTYTHYVLILDNVVPTTDDVDLYIRTSDDNGTTYDGSTGNYGHVHDGIVSGSYTVGVNQRFTDGILLALDVGNGAQEGVSGEVWILNPTNLSNQTKIKADIQYSSYTDNGSGSGLGILSVGGVRLATEDNDAIEIDFVGSTVASGTIRLYGVK